MKKQTRHLVIRDFQVQPEQRTINVAFASSSPVTRSWNGDGTNIVDEVLEISSKAMRTDFLRNGANFLMDHDPKDVIGVVEDVCIDESAKVARAKIKFSESVRAQEIYKDIQQGIRKNISVGYFVYNHKVLDDGTYLVNDWEAVEISSVSIPADRSVGVGRSKELVSQKEGLNQMTEQTKTTKNAKGQETKSLEQEQGTRLMEQEQKQHATVKQVNDAAEIARFAEGKPELEKLAVRAISSGTSFSEFKDQALNFALSNMQKADSSKQSTAHKGLNMQSTANFIGMTDKEAQRFSFFKWIRSQAEPGNRKYAEDAAFEIDAVETATRQKALSGKLRGSHSMPDDVIFAKRTPVSATTTSSWIDTDVLYGSFVGLLKDALLFPGMGATFLNGLTGNVSIPKLASGATAYAIAADSEPAESAMTTTAIPLTPHTIGSTMRLNRSALIQDSLGLENMVRRDIIEQMALYIQKMIIQGRGSGNEPQGIISNNAISILAGGTNGKALDWDDVVRLQTLVASKNAMGNNMAYLTNAMVRGKLMTTEKSSRTAQYIWTDSSTPLNGFPAYITNAMPSSLAKGTSRSCSAVVFGNWSDLIIGMWSGVDMNVDPYSKSTSGAVLITAFQDYDIAIKHKESFAYVRDVLTV